MCQRITEGAVENPKIYAYYFEGSGADRRQAGRAKKKETFKPVLTGQSGLVHRACILNFHYPIIGAL